MGRLRHIVYSVIGIVLSIFMSILNYNINLSLISNTNQFAKLGLIILIPILIICYLLNGVGVITVILNSILGMTSTSKSIKTTSIILFIIGLTSLGFFIFLVIQIIGLF